MKEERSNKYLVNQHSNMQLSLKRFCAFSYVFWRFVAAVDVL